MSPERRFPSRVDVNPTASCQLSCPMCIGPDHNLTDEIDTVGWRGIIKFFSDRGTKRITFTGGEPLMRQDIDILLAFAKSCGMLVTLSTNALSLEEHIDAVAAFVDEVGIPIDGSTKEINGILRVGNDQQFEAAVSGIWLVRNANPNIEITVRTVATTANLDDFSKIGQLLSVLPIDRWKIYELIPANGIIYTSDKSMNWDALKVYSEFDARISDLKSSFPRLNIATATVADQVKGYVLVWPDGFIVNLFKANIGSFLTDPPEVLEANLSSGLVSNF